MVVSSLQPQVKAADLPPEQLAGSTVLTEDQKIAEASRQFEAILLRQILQETQKTVIASRYSDNSTSSGIYRDMITSQLAESISKSGSFGVAKTFERQLSQPARSSEPTATGQNAASGAQGAQSQTTRPPAVQSPMVAHPAFEGPHDPPLSSLVP